MKLIPSVLTAAAISLVACNDRSTPAVEPPTGSAQPAEATAEVVEATEALASELREALASGDEEALVACVNEEAFVDRVFYGLSGRDSDIKGAREGFSGSRPLLRILTDMVAADALVQKVVEVEGSPQIQIRIIMENGGINFLRGSVGGEPLKIIDFFQYSLGEDSSTAARKTIQDVLVKSGTISRIVNPGAANAAMAEATKIGDLATAMRAGDAAEAKRVFAGLGEQTKTSPAAVGLLCATLDLTDESDLEIYESAVDGAIKANPNSGAAQFLGVDYHFFRKEYADARALTDKLMEDLGRDAALLNLKANIFFEEGDIASAIETLKEAIALEPENTLPRFTLADIALIENDYEELAAQFTIMEEQGLDFSGIVEMEEYQAFIASEEGAFWRKGAEE